MKSVLIIGATSAIASQTAKIFASNGYKLALAGRDSNKLDSVKNDIKTNYSDAKVNTYIFNALEYSTHKYFFDNVLSDFGVIDIVLIAYGTLPNQIEIQNSNDEIRKSFDINMISVISISNIVAEYFESIKSGTIAVISSVAGDRGRQSNYIYGAAKGGLSIYLQGLRNRLYKFGVNVITIKPGFVDTPMTANINKNFLFAKPDMIAKGIVKSIDNKCDIVYLPEFWRLIMFVIKHIPEFIFKRLSL